MYKKNIIKQYIHDFFSKTNYKLLNVTKFDKNKFRTSKATCAQMGIDIALHR